MTKATVDLGPVTCAVTGARIINKFKLAEDRNRKMQSAKNKPKSKPKAKTGPRHKPKWYLETGKINVGQYSVDGVSIGSGAKRARARGMVKSDSSPSNGFVQNTGHTSQNTIRVSRKEVVAQMSGSVAFASTPQPIQPGNVGLFPWLSRLAPLYEKYKFHRLVFTFIAQGSGYAVANMSGRCVMCVDFNVLSANIQSIADAEMKDPNVAFVPYEDAILRVETSLLTPKPLFTRGVAYPAGGDPKSYDGGMFYFIANSTPNTSEIGTLFVEYDVELYAPQLSEIAQPQSTYSLYQRSADTGQTWTNLVVNNLVFGSTAYPATGGIPITQEVVLGFPTGVFTLPAGNYVINASATVTSSTLSLTRWRMYYSIDGGPNVLKSNWESASSAREITSSMTICLQAKQGTTFVVKMEPAFSSGALTTVCGTILFQIV